MTNASQVVQRRDREKNLAFSQQGAQKSLSGINCIFESLFKEEVECVFADLGQVGRGPGRVIQEIKKNKTKRN